MKRKSDKEIMSASRPQEIFSMNPDTLEQEKEEYLEEYKPQAYSTIKNFLVTQKVITLYREALEEISESGKENNSFSEINLTIADKHGKTYEFSYHYVYDVKLGKMYVAENNIIFVIDAKNKQYYENYVRKVTDIPKINSKTWGIVQYMFPSISANFQAEDGNWIIITDKPKCQIYPLKEILKYFDAKLKPEYVASILTRLYYFAVYLEISRMQHNGITLDNLFFAPGKEVAEGEDFTVQDMRIVGVYGGWFFTTSSDEKVKGMPKSVFEIMPPECKKSGYSSFKVDMLSIKRLARELLGDVTGIDLGDVPEPMKEWVTSSYSHKNAYEEFCAWEKVIKQSFGKHRFVSMDISIY